MTAAPRPGLSNPMPKISTIPSLPTRPNALDSLHRLVAVIAALGFAACDTGDAVDDDSPADEARAEDAAADTALEAQLAALQRMPQVDLVVLANDDVPTLVTGDLGFMPKGAAPEAARSYMQE